MEFLREFIGLSGTDTVLDVACGSGDLAIFAAKAAKSVGAVDISDKQIDIAKAQSTRLGIKNVTFLCSNVEHLPFESNSFSVVLSKSAFHHFGNFEQVINEMFRCCKQGGLICIDDITTYEDPLATDIIDRMDKLMDVSHNHRLSIAEFNKQFSRLGMTKVRTKITEVERSVKEYQEHALQSAANAKRLEKLIRESLLGSKINKYMYKKNEQVYFVNRSYTIVGTKPLA